MGLKGSSDSKVSASPLLNAPKGSKKAGQASQRARSRVKRLQPRSEVSWDLEASQEGWRGQEESQKVGCRKDEEGEWIQGTQETGRRFSPLDPALSSNAKKQPKALEFEVGEERHGDNHEDKAVDLSMTKKGNGNIRKVGKKNLVSKSVAFADFELDEPPEKKGRMKSLKDKAKMKAFGDLHDTDGQDQIFVGIGQEEVEEQPFIKKKTKNTKAKKVRAKLKVVEEKLHTQVQEVDTAEQDEDMLHLKATNSILTQCEKNQAVTTTTIKADPRLTKTRSGREVKKPTVLDPSMGVGSRPFKPSARPILAKPTKRTKKPDVKIPTCTEINSGYVEESEQDYTEEAQDDEFDDDISNVVGELLTSTITWLRDGDALAAQLEQSQDLLVNLLKRTNSGGEDRASKKGKKDAFLWRGEIWAKVGNAGR